MKLKLTVPAQAEPTAAGARGTTRGGEAEAGGTGLLDAVELVAAFNLSPSARARAAAPTPIELEHDDILEVEVEGGFTLWTSVARYRTDLARLRPESVRGDEIAFDWVPRPTSSERGVREWAASALRVLRLRDDALSSATDLAGWSDFAANVGLARIAKAGAWVSTKFLIWKIERQLRPGEGLYCWADAIDATAVRAAPLVPLDLSGTDGDQPMLVFIHGTASSTRGSFGALADAAARSDWDALSERFGERIYGFEHRTLSASPIENAIRLVQALPARARISLVTHSRGGLVGDLLCLERIAPEAIAAVRRYTDDLAPADAHDQECLKTLDALLAAKQLRIERYLRCACPARGTLLASENIDQFLSVLTNLVGLIPGLAASPLYEVVKRITLQTVKNRWQPALLPGVETMTPASPLVQLLNSHRGQVAGELGVIAGDIEGGHWLKRLGVFLTDQFIYESQDNDLVVNTDSMFDGAPRARVHYVFDQGGDVTHFNYFRNERTRAAMLRWITAISTPPEFRERSAGVESEPVPMMRAIARRSGVAQPVVIVVPGLTGSHLSVGPDADGDRIWLHYLRLAAGGLGELREPATHPVRAVSLLGDYYRDFIESLSDSHEVLAFAYDWRRSIADSAALLAAAIEQTLERTDQPVRIVAHSMGGLVARHLIAQRPQLWDRLCARSGGRLLMLGTPNRGSHAMVDALIGTAATVQRLALLDLSRGRSGVIEIIQSFPGVLELLPQSADERWFERATWNRLRTEWKLAAQPAPGLLAKAAAVLRQLPENLPHSERVLYVAGSAAQTITGFEIVEGQVVQHTTSEGDGSVTYASGRLPGVATWYMEAEHGALAAHPPGFAALRELLDHGTTTRLPTAPPSSTRGGAVVARTLPQAVLYPTAADLTAGLLGRARGAGYEGGARTRLRVSVVHGDLRYARYPIVVGHYEGDTIVGAEARLDQLLEGALATRYNLGLYPGTSGSVAVVLRAPSPLQRALKLPSGAVVVGLGRWGELTAAQLANLLRRAALHYVLQLDEGGRGLMAEGDPVGLSLLLIGTNSTASIATDDSVGAILRGVAQANLELAGRVPAARRIDEVEIIELFADTAIEAARATRRLAASLGDELQVQLEAAPLLSRGRNGRARLTPVQGREPWRRWEISMVETTSAAIAPTLAERLLQAVRQAAEPDPELVAAVTGLTEASRAHAAVRALRFVSMSDRARAEVMQQQRQPELIERLIQASITQTRFRPDEARALFELLVPNDLKDGLAQLARVVFVVDAETAQYPWELMVDGKEPIATRMGLVRQLKTARFRPHIRATTAPSAYVVGDPIVSAPFAQLPGAREEARLVAELLRGRFEPNWREERLGALEVLGGLFERPYRIIHLAGHGHFSPPSGNDPGRSGMVLDNGVFLTAVEIGQMQQVPELVFLNCCYIGQVGAEAPPGVPYNRLAASVARELIEIGVRAVVAAGWAVRDDAALVFARTFYEQMLDGQSFGRALQEARSRLWLQFPDCNTWGAYQAYGDPDFRLDAAGNSSTRRKSALDFVAPEELIDVLRESRQVAAEIERGERGGDAASAARDLASASRRISELVKDCPAQWLAQGEVLAELGLTFGELAQFEPAIRYLSEALEADELNGRATLAAAEKLANYEARFGQRLATTPESSPAERAAGAAHIERAIGRLMSLGSLGRTAERLSLLASGYKRLAQVRADRAEIRLALGQCARYYREAHELNESRGRFDSYPVLNWLTLDTLLAQPVPDADSLLARVDAAAQERFARSKDFFDAAALAETALIRALRGPGSNLVAARDSAEQIGGLYVSAATLTQATPRQIDSVTSQFGFIEQMLTALAIKDDTAERWRSLFAAIRAQLGAPSSDHARKTVGPTPRVRARAKAAKTGAKTLPKIAARRATRRRTSGISG